MSESFLSGVIAALMCFGALFQFIAWIGGACGGQAWYAFVAAWFAVGCWMTDKRVERLEKRIAA